MNVVSLVGRTKSHKTVVLCASLCVFVLLYTMTMGMVGHARGASYPQRYSMKKMATYIISGTVFDDYNENGVQDTREPGINGIIVTAYNDVEKAVSSAKTGTVGDNLGQYTLIIPAGTGPVRMQFSNFGAQSSIPELVGFQPSNHIGGTPVVFVDGKQSANTANLGIERPEEYCQNNPDMATSCYVQGDQTKVGTHVVVRFPYNSAGTEVTHPPTPLANDTDVGTTLGLAYRRATDDLFAAAYTKLLAGYKPGGSTGAIYLIHGADSTFPTVSQSPFIDLNALFGAGTAGVNPHNASNNYDPDLSAYDAVGKTALGGLALSEDESTLYAMNLANRSLYSIPIGAPPAAPVAPDANAITVTQVPIPSDCSAASDLRPFAVTVYRNLVYVGAVCSAESSITPSLPKGDAAQLKAYVFAYTPGIGFASVPVFETPLNYIRHCADGAFTHADTCTINGSAKWNPWQPDSTKIYPSTIHPQPMFTSMTFDNGDLILGLRDRYGDQTGHSVAGVPESRSAGDDLRACLNTPGDFASGWTLENNATCGAITIAGGQNNNKGPGNGEYYYQQYYYPFHDYTSDGGVDQIPGFPDVMSIGFDPGPVAFTGGVRTYNNTQGNETRYYEIYNTNQVPSTFGKANGLGELVAFCHAAPVEIGDRVWRDTNGNGIQDVGEPGVGGVTVNLYAADGTTLLQTTTTDANGTYYFPIASYTNYVVKLDHASDYTTGPLKNSILTRMNQDNAHIIDSKATLTAPGSAIGAGNYPQMLIGSHTPGQNDTTFGVGFITPPDAGLTKGVIGGDTNYRVGDKISYALDVSTSLNEGPVYGYTPLIVTDPLPAGFNKLSASGTDWKIALSGTTSPAVMTALYMGATPILPGAVLPSIIVSGTLNNQAVGTLRNVASITLQGDANNTDNTSSEILQVSPALPDFTVGLAHEDHGCVKSGDQVNYTVTVMDKSDAGSVMAGQPVTVVVTLPMGLNNITLPDRLRSMRSNGGSDWHIMSNGTTLTAIYSGSYPINPGTTLSPITITALLKTPTSTDLFSHAQVIFLQGSKTVRNRANDILPVCPPDLTLSKFHQGSGPFYIGKRVAYSITVSDKPGAGPVIEGQPIVVTDLLPDGLKQIKASGSGWDLTLTATRVIATYRGSYPVLAGKQLPPIIISGVLKYKAFPTLTNRALLRTSSRAGATVVMASDQLPVQMVPPRLPPTGSDPMPSAVHTF